MNMKRLITLFAILIFTGWSIQGAEKMITLNDLPGKAGTFIKQYFSSYSLSYAKAEQKLMERSYEAVLINQATSYTTKIRFDKNGDWQEIESYSGSISSDILPVNSKNAITKQFPEAKIIKIGKDTKGYYVKLDNGKFLGFNKKGKLITVRN